MLDDDLLNNAEQLSDADRNGSLRLIASAGAIVRETLHLADEVDLDQLRDIGRPRSIVVLADGILAASIGELIIALTEPRPLAPIVQLADVSPLPLWVGVSDLVLVASTRGDDDRLIQTVSDAVRRGSSVIATAPLDSPLREACPPGRATYLPTPALQFSPAASWGPWTALSYACGITEIATFSPAEATQAADRLDEIAQQCRLTSDTFMNPAKQLALDLGETIPLFWGVSSITTAVARHSSAQFAASAAAPALAGGLPAVIDEYGGLLDNPGSGAADFFADRIDEQVIRPPRLVLLRDTAQSPYNQQLAQHCAEWAADHNVSVRDLAAEGETPLERFASLVGLVDFAAAYLGLAQGMDPAGPRIGQPR